MMGREYGGEDSKDDTVDLPVAIEPVSPIISIVLFLSLVFLVSLFSVAVCLVVVGGEVDAELPRFLYTAQSTQ